MNIEGKLQYFSTAANEWIRWHSTTSGDAQFSLKKYVFMQDFEFMENFSLDEQQLMKNSDDPKDYDGEESKSEKKEGEKAKSAKKEGEQSNSAKTRT